MNVFYFIAINNMDFATASTLTFSATFFIVILSIFFLNDKVGIYRWSAVIIGFIGVIIIIRPQGINFNYLFNFPILAAIFLTIRDILTKNIVNKKNSFEIILVTSILMTLFSGISSICFGFNIQLNQILNILFSSIFLTFGYLFSVMTIFYAPLSLTATARYSVIIFGIIFGYIILKEIPTLNMIIGAIIITLSGIFVIKRQKDLGKIE